MVLRQNGDPRGAGQRRESYCRNIFLPFIFPLIPAVFVLIGANPLDRRYPRSPGAVSRIVRKVRRAPAGVVIPPINVDRGDKDV
jgi:hypothetical protein